MNLVVHPTVTINNFVYRGDITYNDLIKAICAVFNLKQSECNTDEMWKQHTNPELYKQQ